MTPNAHVAAAIDILDAILDEIPAEKALTNWARRSRFAGSKDRAAVRDLVFDALRQKRSLGFVGGESGRGLMHARLLRDGENPAEVFDGEGYGPVTLSAAEIKAVRELSDASEGVQLDCPDWVWPLVAADWEEQAGAIMSALRHRAPVFVRANLVKTSRDAAILALAQEGILGEESDISPSAVKIIGNSRRIGRSDAYRSGFVELQDAASQAVVDTVCVHFKGDHLLDYCAGGGGKALAFAASGAHVTAHDIDAKRMADIPTRAKRAGVKVEVTSHADGQFDCVFCDVPCSGSGAWRRQPDAKWRLNADRLTELQGIQDGILLKAISHVRPGGILAYATCSIFRCENDERVNAFLKAAPNYREIAQHQFLPTNGADGLFVSVMQNAAEP